MGKFSLENNIKDRLKGHEVHINKRELWKSLGIEEEEKDRKAIWFWWFAGLAGIVFIAGLWWLGQRDTLEASYSQKAADIEMDESLAKTGNEKIIENSTSERLSEIIEDVKSKGEQSENGVSPSTNELRNVDIRKGSISPATNMDDESRKGIPIEQKSNYDTHLNNESKTANFRIEKTINGGEVLNEILMIESLPQITSMLAYNRDVEDMDAEVNPLIKPISKSRKFEFELYGGIGSINRALSTTNEEFDGYIAGRDSSESTLEHVSLGIAFKYMIGRGFYGKAGVGVNRWNEKYSYTITSDTTATSVTIPDVILIDLQGNQTTTQFTEGTKTSYTITDWVRYNRLTQIDVPVSLGYEHRIKRWSLFGEASAIFNVKQMFSGYVYTPEGELINNPEFFKTSIGLNFGVNAGVGYGITPRIRARISARYYQSLGSVLRLDHPIEQKYTSLGLRVGVGYLF